MGEALLLNVHVPWHTKITISSFLAGDVKNLRKISFFQWMILHIGLPDRESITRRIEFDTSTPVIRPGKQRYSASRLAARLVLFEKFPGGVVERVVLAGRARVLPQFLFDDLLNLFPLGSDLQNALRHNRRDHHHAVVITANNVAWQDLHISQCFRGFSSQDSL